MTHLADGLKSAAPSLIGVSSEEFVELKPSITTLLVSFRINFCTVLPLVEVLFRLKKVKPGQDAAKYISGRYYLCYISLLSGWRNIINAGVPYRYKYIFTSLSEKGHLAGQRWRR